MSPKTKFNKETIIEAAFEIGKEEGLSRITARNVAKRLGCSVAPIYVNFATIDDLIEAVVERIFAVSEQLLAMQEGSNLFQNIGKASLAFARNYPVFLRELIMKPNPYLASYGTVENEMIKTLGEDESMNGWTVEERKRLFLKMRMFQLGLSVMVANGHIPPWLEEQTVEELLFEVGEDLVFVQQVKRKEGKK